MSKCSVVKCPAYTSEGQGMDLGKGVFAWVPLCSKHKAEWVSNDTDSVANTGLPSKLAKHPHPDSESNDE